MRVTVQGLGRPSNSQRRKWVLVSATSLFALVLADPASAQSTDAQNAQAGQAGPVQPAVPATANAISASQAGTPQDAVTAPDTAKSNTVDDTSQDIIVTGLRGSLQRNLDIKRNATGVVDAISAEDIGKFPDSNVAASLQRLPGVSIQRAGTRGEATGITVRGFGGDFNTTLYDGRRISTGTGSRQIDFSTVGSDFIGQLSVLKTPDVSLTASSIGATVNIEFPKPFDHPGFRLAASGSGSIQDRSGDVVPTAGLLLSDTFANNTLGVLADFIYTRRDTDSNRVSVQGWPGGFYAPCQLQGTTSTNCAPTSDATSAAYADSRNRQTIAGFFPQQYLINKESTKDERYDGRIALQWHPSEDLMVTIDDNFSRQTVVTDVNNVGFWFNQGALRNVVLDKNGQPTNFTQTGTPTDFGAQINTQVLQTNQIGGNVKWDVGEHFTLDGDLSYSKSWLNPDKDTIGSQSGDIGYGGALGLTTGLQILGDSTKAFPVLTAYGPSGNMANYANTALIGSHVAVNQTQNNTDELKQARLTATWKQDDVTLKVGGQYIEDQFQLSNKSTFTNNYWQAYAGYGGPSGSTTGINPLPASLFQGTVGLGNFIPGYKGSLPPALLVYSPIAFQNFLTSLGNPQTKTIPGFNAGANIPSFTGAFDQAVDPGSVQTIKEQTWSLYFSAAFKTEIAGMPLNFAAGVRNENTHLTSAGQGRLPLVLNTSAADPTLLSIPDTGYTAVQSVTNRSNYSYLLPSLDVRLGVTDKLQVRFDASRTLTRPSLSLLTPVLNVGNSQRIGALTATGGNPNLKPYLADNFDVAAEWYYKRNSYLSVDFFLKNVSNFIVGGVTRQAINGVVDPTTGQLASFAVTQQVNGPDATVRGVEVAWQQVFGETGFGFQANATFVDTNKPYDPTNLSQTGFAVTGLANSANFVGFYDKHGFQFRAAVNWRDKYLLQFGQAQNTGQFGSEPTFVNSSLQLDLTSSYDINKHVSVFGEVQNVNDNQQSTTGRFANQLLDVYDYGRRFVFGAHYRF
ncbi:TonB-dependent receptor [Sphingomonas sp. PAMC 26605]|uniref:TonB-dependent receptor n=1 Tax=Sphingomonas sp. PAMC 26605 TaxID=1112214 RepID=UPI00026CDD56|nr:TonB-dependent receptor [Sphingomonas sp. PAMC 26605]